MAATVLATQIVFVWRRAVRSGTGRFNMGWIVGIALVVLFVIYLSVRGGGIMDFFVSVHFVPDGMNWRTFYYRLQEGKTNYRRMPAVWIMIGVGVGIAVVALIVAVVNG